MNDMLLRQKPPASKFHNEDIIKIKNLIKQQKNDKEIAHVFMCSRSNITLIRNGNTWSHIVV